ncbi:peptidoglycan D,D-transpeptidase FtsI family protein [Angustibacter luteus]|uniref:Peptidoglycan D,D-transpeptidase FtsI family protein n=1 Tax=Angustibacter luteus TaxID=658456 RepID=A0ABW1JEL8_9ACTN
MNAPIRRLSVLVLVLFGSLLLSSTYIQFVQASSLREKPNNRRTLLENYSRQRGPILITGKPVARSVATDDELKYVRQYSNGELYSHLTGYYSFVYGAGAGIERSENDLLSGQADQLFYRRVVDVLTGREQQGASVELTVDPAAQKAAADGLGEQRGAVVALDPRTGAILAMASNPTYDPNELAGHDLTTVQANYKRLLADDDDPLINRSIQALYPPGSTFKVVTAAAALSSGRYTENSVVPGPAVLDLPQTTANLRNDFAGSCGPNDKVDLTRALQISCNTAFASLGLALGDDAIRAQAEKFGFGDRIGVPMPVAPSIVPADMNKPQTAQAAIGQYDVRVTPLQMAMVAAGVANDGVVMAPYSVKTVRGPDLDVLDQAKPQELSRAVDSSVADQLTRMMEKVVESGTGTRAQIPGIKVAGKTGTAQHAKGEPPHAWFICFAPADDPKVAVAVVVEDGGKAGNEAFGGRIAAPIAKSVMEAVLR